MAARYILIAQERHLVQYDVHLHQSCKTTMPELHPIKDATGLHAMMMSSYRRMSSKVNANPVNGRSGQYVLIS